MTEPHGTKHPAEESSESLANREHDAEYDERYQSYQRRDAQKRYKVSGVQISDLKRLLMCLTIKRYESRPEYYPDGSLDQTLETYGTCTHPDNPDFMTFHAWGTYTLFDRWIKAAAAAHDSLFVVHALGRICLDYIDTPNSLSEKMKIGSMAMMYRYASLVHYEINYGYKKSLDYTPRGLCGDTIPDYWIRPILAHALHQPRMLCSGIREWRVYKTSASDAILHVGKELELDVYDDVVRFRTTCWTGVAPFDAFRREGTLKCSEHELSTGYITSSLDGNMMSPVYDYSLRLPAPGRNEYIDERLLKTLANITTPDEYPAAILADASMASRASITHGAGFTLSPAVYRQRPSSQLIRYHSCVTYRDRVPPMTRLYVDSLD